MAETTVNKQLPPRTNPNPRWPRKWATLGGRAAAPSIPPVDELQSNGKGPSNSIFRKSSTISRTTNKFSLNVEENCSNNENSLKKSRSLINVLRSKLNSPAVLRRFRTKSRDNGKQNVQEINENDSTNFLNEEPNKKTKKRDPSPMHRLTTRLAQLTRSSTHNTINPEVCPNKKIEHDQVDQINACYDEIRAKYFDKSNGTTLPASERLKEMLSTTTTSSIDYYDRPNLTSGELENRSLSTISINGSLLSHDLLNNSQQNVLPVSPTPQIRQPEDPLMIARKQSNIKLNCMLSGYVYKNPFANNDRLFGENDIFKFHHYHDVGKTKFNVNGNEENNRLYSSMRVRPVSRSIDNVRRATTTLFNENSIEEQINELKTFKSKIHIEPAAPVLVKTFISSTSPNKIDPNGNDNEFERNFLRAVDRALALTNSDVNNLLQPIYDTPLNKEISQQEENKQIDDEPAESNGNESPNVELFDRTGDLIFENEQQWQSSALYENQTTPNVDEDHFIQTRIWPVIETFGHKNQDFIVNEIKNGQEFLVCLDVEEKSIKSKADSYKKILDSNDPKISEEILSEIQAVIGEVNLLIGGKMKQFRSLCQANISKSLTIDGEPTPLDTDLAGFWDLTRPLISKIGEKFVKLDSCKSRCWTNDENEIDPADVNRRPKKILPTKTKTTPNNNKTSSDELKKFLEQRRKAASNTENQKSQIEIFLNEK